MSHRTCEPIEEVALPAHSPARSTGFNNATDGRTVSPCQLYPTPTRMAYSPPTFRRKKLTAIRPFVPIADQTSSNGIVQHIFALGLGAFETANPVVKRSILPRPVRRSQLMSDMRFPARDPAIKSHVKFARHGEEMRVIGHDHIRADKPGCAFAPSCL